MSKIIKKRKTSATGLLLELIGFAMLFLWNFNPILSIVGVGLLIAGASQSKKFICSECGNKVEDRNVKICPVCKSEFGR